MNKEKALERLRQHAETIHSDWRECAEWRRENRDWISRSQEIALRMLNSMDKLHLTQRALAERMGCSQQYISKVLKGQENLSLETLVKIENALGIELLVQTHNRNNYEQKETGPKMVAEEAAEYNR